MRMFPSALVLLGVLMAPLFAVINKEIVIGAFGKEDQAEVRLKKVEIFLSSEPGVADLQTEGRFAPMTKRSGKYYISVLTHFLSYEDLQTVLKSVKKRHPDAYPKRYKPTITEPVEQPKAAPVVAPKPEVKPVVTKPAVVETAVQAASSIAAVAVAEAEEVAAPEVEAVKQTASEKYDKYKFDPEADEAVTEADEEDLEEAEEFEEAEMSAMPQTVEESTETEAMEATAEEGDGDMSLIPMAAAMVVVVLILIYLLLGNRGKKAAEPLQEILVEEPEAEPSPVAQVETVEETYEEAAPEVEPEPEPMPEPEPEPVVEAPVVEPEPEPVVEEIVAEEVPVVEEAPEAGPVVRKKREPREHTGKITKDDLAEFDGNRVLMAEDNLINQKVMKRLLEGSGIDLVIAENGQECLDILSNDNNFLLVLMDANMPIMDGFEATRQIRANPNYDHIAVAALSGDVAADDIRRMREAGMEEQLAKPIKVDALFDVMYCYLNIKSEGAAAAPAGGDAPAADPSNMQVLNAGKGLNIAGNDVPMYKEILNEFLETYAEADQLLATYLEHNHEDFIKMLLLDIHGVAANIGAERLANSSEMMREAILGQNSGEYANLQSNFNVDLRMTIAKIHDYLEKN